MKHFYGHIQGDAKNEGHASASKNGSLQAHIRTMNNGIFVCLSHTNGKDEILVYETLGTMGDRKGHPMSLIYQKEFDELRKKEDK
jgi:hypothetical protein